MYVKLQTSINFSTVLAFGWQWRPIGVVTLGAGERGPVAGEAISAADKLSAHITYTRGCLGAASHHLTQHRDV